MEKLVSYLKQQANILKLYIPVPVDHLDGASKAVTGKGVGCAGARTSKGEAEMRDAGPTSDGRGKQAAVAATGSEKVITDNNNLIF